MLMACFPRKEKDCQPRRRFGGKSRARFTKLPVVQGFAANPERKRATTATLTFQAPAPPPPYTEGRELPIVTGVYVNDSLKLKSED
jgi:hypothetical protein